MADRNKNGIDDEIEATFGFDRNVDSDNDGLSDAGERKFGTDPLNPDSDGDGLRDGEEVGERLGVVVERPGGFTLKDLGDGPPRADLYDVRSNPLDADTDNDGLSDAEEVRGTGTDPRHWDTDRDGLGDGDEVALRTNARDADSDDDGLFDGDEVHRVGSDPLNPDTDGDGWTDFREDRFTHTDATRDDTDRDGIIDSRDANPTVRDDMAVSLAPTAPVGRMDPMTASLSPSASAAMLPPDSLVRVNAANAGSAGTTPPVVEPGPVDPDPVVVAEPEPEPVGEPEPAVPEPEMEQAVPEPELPEEPAPVDDGLLGPDAQLDEGMVDLADPDPDAVEDMVDP